jgi:phosphopantothenoylcysteine decarboxylase/phosphopantothenate--cysteine ligase
MGKKKEILLGVTGSIAAYRAPDIVRGCMKGGAGVTVIMTEAARRFIGPLTFSTLTGRDVFTDMWGPPGGSYRDDHIALRDRADLLVIAPATANIIAKVRAGIADDLLSTTTLSMKAPILIAPAMNTAMYESAAVRENIASLKARGVYFVEPEKGDLACGDVGVGRLAAPETIVSRILELLA